MNERTETMTATATKPQAKLIACEQCGAEMPLREMKPVKVKVGREWTTQPMCRHCAANHAAKRAYGGVFLSMATGPNRAVRRHPAAEPTPAKPTRTRRATRGERRQAKKGETKDAARQLVKEVAA